ncbi:MAG: hypothetical protein O7D86_12310 [Proteobacteria bacterium]|nr:hypothetical protein [Pseudomonadota bacterium]
MFGIFKKNKGDDDFPRSLTKPDELQVGDIVSLKERLSLPSELQGAELEVTAVGTYQYSDGLEKEVTLRSVDNKTYYLSMDDNDGDPVLCFSIKLERELVSQLFDLDQFALLFDPDYATLDVHSIPDEIKDWVKDGQYVQEISDAEGYFYNDDLIAKGISPSSRHDDNGEEFRYYSCDSDVDDNYSLLVEVWESGETDVSIEVSTPTDVIAEMWPNAKK